MSAMSARSRRPIKTGAPVFSSDGALEACVAGFVHFAHTSSSDRGQDLVRAEFIACCQGHLVESVQFIRSGGGQVLGHGQP
jgi:hypothetical protein